MFQAFVSTLFHSKFSIKFSKKINTNKKTDNKLTIEREHSGLTDNTTRQVLPPHQQKLSTVVMALYSYSHFSPMR